ncbi:hypothetical protein DLE54_02865 [Psychrobacter sp. YP14]|uniref:hypothetical protein n=1 Tax=Psychrobacter sp. YP14 TaxID=2203895 RepID=UPI000D7E7CCA|nr:hypothetical protein [Psychrobacter sp. YP14]AWT48583.1 hypothetical protein DLE54_02865 [Psychrobacter sp. YP14]
MADADVTFSDLIKRGRQCFAYPSRHAEKRIRQRTSLTPKELMLLLDENVCVDISQKYGLSKRHLLFYSPKDKYYYVALQNVNTGKVITVWHLNYHRQLAWSVTQEQCAKARKIYHDYLCEQQTAKADDNEPLSCQPEATACRKQANKRCKQVTAFKRVYKVYVKASYICESGQAKRKTLLTLEVDYYINDFERSIKSLLKQDETLFDKINHQIWRKRLFHESIYAIVFVNKKDLTDTYLIDVRPHWVALEQAQKIAHKRKVMNRLLLDYQTPYVSLPLPISMRLLRLPMPTS